MEDNLRVSQRQPWIAAILWDLCHHPALTNGLSCLMCMSICFHGNGVVRDERRWLAMCQENSFGIVSGEKKKKKKKKSNFNLKGCLSDPVFLYWGNFSCWYVRSCDYPNNPALIANSRFSHLALSTGAMLLQCMMGNYLEYYNTM